MALCFLLSQESGERRRHRKEPKGSELVLGLPAGKEGEDAACKAKLGLELGGLSGSLPSGYSPTTHCSALLACLLAWLVQDPAPPPFFLFYLPPDALFHSSLTPSKILPAFYLLYHLSPEAVDDLRMREKESKIKELKH